MEIEGSLNLQWSLCDNRHYEKSWFVYFSTTLTVTRTIERRGLGWPINAEFERSWEKAVIASLMCYNVMLLVGWGKSRSLQEASVPAENWNRYLATHTSAVVNNSDISQYIRLLWWTTQISRNIYVCSSKQLRYPATHISALVINSDISQHICLL